MEKNRNLKEIDRRLRVLNGAFRDRLTQCQLLDDIGVAQGKTKEAFISYCDYIDSGPVRKNEQYKTEEAVANLIKDEASRFLLEMVVMKRPDIVKSLYLRALPESPKKGDDRPMTPLVVRTPEATTPTVEMSPRQGSITPASIPPGTMTPGSVTPLSSRSPHKMVDLTLSVSPVIKSRSPSILLTPEANDATPPPLLSDHRSDNDRSMSLSNTPNSACQNILPRLEAASMSFSIELPSITPDLPSEMLDPDPVMKTPKRPSTASVSETSPEHLEPKEKRQRLEIEGSSNEVRSVLQQALDALPTYRFGQPSPSRSPVLTMSASSSPITIDLRSADVSPTKNIKSTHPSPISSHFQESSPVRQEPIEEPSHITFEDPGKTVCDVISKELLLEGYAQQIRIVPTRGSEFIKIGEMPMEVTPSNEKTPEPCSSPVKTVTIYSPFQQTPTTSVLNILPDPASYIPMFPKEQPSLQQSLAMTPSVETPKTSAGSAAVVSTGPKVLAEAAVLQRIGELQKEGMWYDKRLPKASEPSRIKVHWDYLLEEMTWLAADFASERKWKKIAAKRCSKMIDKYWQDKALAAQRAMKDEGLRVRKIASFLAKEVRNFWSNVQRLVEAREQSRIEELRQKTRDQHLSFLVDQTERYSTMLAESFVESSQIEEDELGLEKSIVPDPEDVEYEPVGFDGDDEETIAKAEEEDSNVVSEVELLKHESEISLEDLINELPEGYIQELSKVKAEAGPSTKREDKKKDLKANKDDDEDEDSKVDEFIPNETGTDSEGTLEEEEAKDNRDAKAYKAEIKELEDDNMLSIEELKAKYATGNDLMEMTDDESSEDEDDSKDSDSHESDEVAALLSSEDPSDLSDNETEEEQTLGLASLLQTCSPVKLQKNMNADEDVNSVAQMAQAFQPTGYTFSSCNVALPVPHLLRHNLREYQHIGLEWLVTMYDKKLNGILADEMGLGKTIQTIALLAHLACEKMNWGPHLIVVPTSVMLNWEMEIKKWCPGFKILTYYGSQKERKQKRSGWTKPNSFHICITSYKLVIQDHHSFRRKRWKYLILDEAQNIKNFKSQRWQLLLNFQAQRRLLLTGTPLQNNLMELWSLMHFLMPNVFQSHREFRDWFSNPVTTMIEGNSEYNDNIIQRLHKILRPFILRRLKSQVEKQLPSKYEHVVMCRLSKRQRFLYEDFMSRTKTKETLNSGNLLSVINVLMQLRKVCNHPNLFESRPIISPLRLDGILYKIPSLVWNVKEENTEKNSMYNLYNFTSADFSLDHWSCMRIRELLPPHLNIRMEKEEDNAPFLAGTLKDRKTMRVTLVGKLLNMDSRSKKLFHGPIWGFNAPPPCPRLNTKINFFALTTDPSDLIYSNEMKTMFGHGVPNLQSLIVDRRRKFENDISIPPPIKKTKLDYDEPILITNQVYQKNDAQISHDATIIDETMIDANFELERDLKTGTMWMINKSIDPRHFSLMELQERALKDRKSVIEKLQCINEFRCSIDPIYGRDLIDACNVFTPPPVFLYRRPFNKICFPMPPKPKHIYPNPFYHKKKDFETCHFMTGISEVQFVLQEKNERSQKGETPRRLVFTNTNVLLDLIWSPETLKERLCDTLNKFLIYVPPVSCPMIKDKVIRPFLPAIIAQDEYETEMSCLLKEPKDILHSIITSSMTQFPDPRLIQYDCGKLQVLDKLLRRLKLGSHRALIFTQMAKMLDVLELFLNYHGHIYLRLDGATSIEQRQVLMERFNSDKRIFCFILSTRSGGIGVNLTGADTVIFYDSDWNPTMDAQAQDRCHRIGQTRDVHIYRLVSEKTIEENILKKSNQKRLLGELAIEGGNFTTAYFKKNTIHELFEVDEREDDPIKRMASVLTTGRSHDPFVSGEIEEIETVKTIKLSVSQESVEEKDLKAKSALETALAEVEDEADVEAAKTLRSEADAELAEFDENVPIPLENDQGTASQSQEIAMEDPLTVEEKMAILLAELSPVEKYALKFMETTIDEWSPETFANAQREMEDKKKGWEVSQMRKLEANIAAQSELDEPNPEDILTYSSEDAHNKIWISSEEDEIMPLWSPPTPPQDDSDVYVDSSLEFLYKKTVIPAHQLPPVYVPPAQKKPYYDYKRGYVNSPKENTPPSLSPMKDDEHGGFSDPLKKSPKLKRDEPIFAPRSLFDRPTPALAKMRRDFKLQKFSGRPIIAGMSKTLPTGMQGSISFPMMQNSKSTPQPQSDGGDWLILEDFTLLEAVQHMMELPLNLLVVNLAQTPNWEFCSEIVNMVSRTYRTAKQSRIRYESFVGPREEGKLVQIETQQPPAKKSKKKPPLIKGQPQAPSKPARLLKTSQMMIQDNNSQISALFNSKFDFIKGVAAKRNAPKPVACSPAFKVFKQTAIFQEHGIAFDNPLSATSIAQARYDRIQLERKRIIQAQQAQAAQNLTTVPSGGSSPGTQASAQTPPSSSPITSTVPSPILASSPATASEVVQKARISAGAVSLGGLNQPPVVTRGIMPIVITSNASSTSLGELMSRSGATTGQIVTTTNAPQAKRQYSVVPSSQAAKPTGGKTPPTVRQTNPQTLSVSTMSTTAPHLLQYVSKNSSHIVVQQVGQQQSGGILQPSSPASQPNVLQQKAPTMTSKPSPITVTTATVVTTTTNTSSSTVPPVHLVPSSATAGKGTQKGRVGQTTGIFARNMMPFVLSNASTMSTANLNELIARGSVGVISPANAPAVSATATPKRYSMTAQPHYQIITQNQKGGAKIGPVRVSTASAVVQQQQQASAAASGGTIGAASHMVQYVAQKSQIVVQQQPIQVSQKGAKTTASFQTVVSSSQVVTIPAPMGLSVSSPTQVVSSISGTASEAVQKAKLAAGQQSGLYPTRNMMPIVLSQGNQNTNLSELIARGVIAPTSGSSVVPAKRQYSVLARTVATTGAMGQASTTLTSSGGGPQVIQYTSGKNPILLQQQQPIQIQQQGGGAKGQTVVLSSGLAQALGAPLEPPSTGPLASSLIGSPSVSLSQSTLIQQPNVPQVQRTIKMQLVKQHTVGGKTVTRPVSDAEVAVFLKQHGITQSRLAFNQQASQAVKTTMAPTRAGGATASQIISPANLQKLGFQVQTSGTGSAPVATIVKAPVSQGGGTGPGLVPFALSQVKTLVLQQGLNQPVSFRLHTPTTSSGTSQIPPISSQSSNPLLAQGIPIIQQSQQQQAMMNPMMFPVMGQQQGLAGQTTSRPTTPASVTSESPQNADIQSKIEEPNKDSSITFDPSVIETLQGPQIESNP